MRKASIFGLQWAQYQTELQNSSAQSQYRNRMPAFQALSLLVRTNHGKCQGMLPDLAYWVSDTVSCSVVSHLACRWFSASFANKGLGVVFKLGCRTTEDGGKAVQWELYVSACTGVAERKACWPSFDWDKGYAGQLNSWFIYNGWRLWGRRRM